MSSNQKQSWVWSYFSEKGRTTANCNLCQRDINRSGGRTTGMANHMKLHNIFRSNLMSDIDQVDTELDNDALEQDEPPNKIPRLSPEVTMNTATSHKIMLSDFLTPDENTKGRGICKMCSKSVLWNKRKLASHKRKNCPIATDDDRKIFITSKVVSNSGKKVSKSTSSDASWKISNYLENFENATGKGTCMSCQKSVQWSRAKIESHLRNSCLKNIESAKVTNTTQPKSPKKVLKSAALKTSCYICNCSTGATSTRLVQSLEFTKTLLFEVLGKQN